MPQWGSKDQANNSVLWAGALVNKTANVANRDALYGNGTATGIFAVNDAEQAASDGKYASTGWIKRTVGTGGRAGRILTETLVAIGITTDGSDDAIIPDASLRITTQPAAANVTAPAAASFTVAGESTPNVAISYQWQANTGSGYANLSNGGVYSNVTTATLSISNSTGLNGNRYRAILSATGAANVTSTGALLTVA